MTPTLPSALREEFDRISDVPAPAGLADAALRQAARRQRTRTVVVAGALAVVALLGVPVVVSALTGSDGQIAVPPAHSSAPSPSASISPPTAPAPSGQHRVVVAYAGQDSSLLLDPTTGTYRQLPHGRVLPAPRGDRLLVVDGNGPDDRIGVLDQADAPVRWIDTALTCASDRAAWSPDGNRIVVTCLPKDGPNGFAIIDAATLTGAFVELPDTTSHNSMGLKLLWTPEGNNLVLTLSRAVGNENLPDKVDGLRFYGLDGTAIRTVLATAALAASSGFSPDGTRAALFSIGDNAIQIVNLTTGKVEQTVPAYTRLANLIGWYDNEHLVLEVAGADRELRVLTLTGAIARTVPIAHALRGSAIIGPADGLTGPAAQLAF